MGREEGGGFRMGNTCIPVADSFWYLVKPMQFVKFKNKKKERKITLLPLNYLYIFVKSQLGLLLKVYFWFICSVPPSCVFLSPPISHCLDSCTYTIKINTE